MSFFAQPTDAPIPKTTNIRLVSLLLAGIIIIMAVAQLFTFEDYSDVIVDLTGLSTAPAALVAAMVVILEVTALPFLFSMRLSVLGRIVSMVSGWTVVLGWFVMSLYSNITASNVTNSGVLGNTVSLPEGWWTTFFFAGVTVLAIWSSWGMWPFVQAAKK